MKRYLGYCWYFQRSKIDEFDPDKNTSKGKKDGFFFFQKQREGESERQKANKRVIQKDELNKFSKFENILCQFIFCQQVKIFDIKSTSQRPLFFEERKLSG